MTKQSNIHWPTKHKKIKHQFKKKFGKLIRIHEIKTLWFRYLEHIKSELLKGGEVFLDERNSIEIVGVPVVEHRSFKLFIKAKRVLRKRLVRLKFNSHRKDFIYDIKMRNSVRPGLLFFPNKKLRVAVHNTLITTNTYFKIERGSRKI